MPEISVVISLFNKAGYIARAIDSVLAQKFRDFEVIVVNDASTDGGERIARRYKDRGIRLLNRPAPSPGGHAARNLGIKESSGNLIAFLDADDEWTPEFLETVIRLKKKHHEAGVFATAYIRKYKDGRIKNPDFRESPKRKGGKELFRIISGRAFTAIRPSGHQPRQSLKKFLHPRECSQRE